MEKFAERLIELRNNKGISQIQLAIDTNISKSAIAFWELGKRIPNAQAVVVLAKYFEVSCDYLLGVSDII